MLPKAARPYAAFHLRALALKKASEYHQRADECRALAAKTSNSEHKAMLHSMADTWETLAQQREALLARKARIAALETGLSQEARKLFGRWSARPPNEATDTPVSGDLEKRRGSSSLSRSGSRI